MYRTVNLSFLIGNNLEELRHLHQIVMRKSLNRHHAFWNSGIGS